MQVRIIGAGSLGLLLAGLLRRRFAETVVVARSELQSRLLNERGLTVVEPEGEFTVFPRAVGPADAGRITEPPDWIVLTVKQTHIDRNLLEMLRGQFGERTKLVCFQNGIGHVERLAAALPAGRIYSAVTTEGAKRTSPHTVEHTGRGHTWIGRPAPDVGAGGLAAKEDAAAGGGDSGPRDLRQLQEMLQTAGLACSVPERIEPYIWNKLIINAVINPLTALVGVPNGVLPADPDLRQLMQQLLAEAETIARRAGIELAGDRWEQLLTVCERTAANRSSMLQDVEAGRPTELDWITGSLLGMAERLGVEAPSHRLVYSLMKAKERAIAKKHD